MSRLQAIENALSSINSAAFQELCDSFLALRNPNYSAFSRTGSQSGKQKTIKGTPDTFLLLPNGKYIFVEYSTNVTAGLSKLEEDIKKCIDVKKTGIPIDQIAEIILCINFNLKANDVEALMQLLKDTRIRLTIYTLDALAIELHFHHRDLTHQYLDLPLDTGQVVSIERFIEEYNNASKGISTPLDNTFLHREKELQELNEAVSANNFIILTGPPGVGKTKLALEGIRNYLKENLSYSAYCISYKNHTLLDDLYQYLDSAKDYILFVDDANRMDAFNQVIGFFKASRKGKLKIIVTVRDYAYQDIGMLCNEFSPTRIDLLKFTDEQIIEIIKAAPFNILNSVYHKEIVRIADGNPRLAIMTALLSIAKQNIHVLADVSDLFENYFSTFIKDNGEFANEFNIRCLGLIAFFYTIPYKDRQITTSILDNFNIGYSSFIDAIDKLDKLELVEIQFEHVKIPEQNLSTYFFYKAFVKDNLLSFEKLLDKYFDSNVSRFKDCVIPANNTFGYENVLQKLKPHLQSYWGHIKSEEEGAFKFLSAFWFYLQRETLEFVFNIVESLPANDSLSEYDVTYEINAFAYDKNKILELVGEFFRFRNELKDALQLSFEYVRKLPNHLSELIHNIKEELTFDKEDQDENFARQIILYRLLIEELNKKDPIYSVSFFELSKTFLGFKFRKTRGGRNMSIIMYEYPIPNNKIIQDFRKEIWNALDNNFESNPVLSFDLLKSYGHVQPDVSSEIMEYDVPFVLQIIEKHLSPVSFEHCKYVQDQIRWCKENLVSHPSFDSFANKFTNATYEIFLKIDWDRFRDKESFEFDDYREYEKLKEKEIRTSFLFKDIAEVKFFYSTFLYLKNVASNNWNYNKTLDHVIDENCSINFIIGCQLLAEVIENNNEVNYLPWIVFKNHLTNKINTEHIWSIIQSRDFQHKAQWELSFYEYIADPLLNQDYVQGLINTIKGIKEPYTIHLDRLERFLKIEPKLFQIILRIIFEKNEQEKRGLQVWMDFFSTHFDQLGDDIALIKKAYLQQDRLQNHFDFEGKGFLNILKKDQSFLIDYINSLYSQKKFGLSSDKRHLEFVWQVEAIESTLKEAFELVVKKEAYFGISAHFCNSFFRNLKDEMKLRAKTFLIEYCKENFSDFNKMNVIIDIIRHSMRESFSEILLLFLSLTQDRETFSRIWWRGNGGSYTGNVIIGDVQAAEWRSILSIIETSDVGIKLLPIKKYVADQIESSLKYGDHERQRRFLERY